MAGAPSHPFSKSQSEDKSRFCGSSLWRISSEKTLPTVLHHFVERCAASSATATTFLALLRTSLHTCAAAGDPYAHGSDFKVISRKSRVALAVDILRDEGASGPGGGKVVFKEAIGVLAGAELAGQASTR